MAHTKAFFLAEGNGRHYVAIDDKWTGKYA